MIIPFAKVDCSGNELNYVTEVLKSGWLTTASKTKSLEDKFAEFLGCKHVFAVNSCTSALHLALDALNVKAGDDVFVPTHTFTASAEVIRYMGANPVLLDVEYDTGLITPDIVAEAIKNHPDVRVLIGVHFAGQSLEMSNSDSTGILDICRANDVEVVEDAAHALPSKCQDKYIGTFGEVTCFSFYANKTMTTGEGGLIVTNNDKIAARIKLMRLHGIDRDVWNRFTDNGNTWEYDVLAPGYKYNMPDVNAAIGLAQLERLEEMREKRQQCAEFYYDSLSGLDGITLPTFRGPIEHHAWHLFPIKVNSENRNSRNDFISKLNNKGVGTSVHYKPIHHLSYYKERYSLNAKNYPVSELIWNQTLSLPIYNLLNEEELKYICDAIRY